MKIYTKAGDQGATSLFGGKRISKGSLIIEAYGTVDELNSYVGLVRDQPVNKERSAVLIEIQDRLFTIGSILATEPGNEKIKTPSLSETDIVLLERNIDLMEEKLPPMKSFLLPGGHPSVSFGHISRTICRRAERLVIMAGEQQTIDSLVVKYLNRLSDFLFVLCRKMAQELPAEELPWKPRM